MSEAQQCVRFEQHESPCCSLFLGWKRRIDTDDAFNSVELAARPLLSLQTSPSLLSSESFSIRDVNGAALCCESAYFLGICQSAGVSGVLDHLAATNSFSMSSQFWSGQTSQPSSSRLQRIASAVRIAGIIRPLVQRFGRTARFPPELLFALLSSSADACVVHWACAGLAEMNALHPGVWHPMAYLPLPQSEQQKEPNFMKRFFTRKARVAPLSETSQHLMEPTFCMTFKDAASRFQISHRVDLSLKNTWY